MFRFIKKSLKLVLKIHIKLLRQILIKTHFIQKIGLLGFGETNLYNINCFYMTLDIENADFNICFSEKTKLPFKNNSLNIVYSSHNLEHLNESIADQFFKESYRVLKPNRELLIEVPNTQLLWEAYGAYLSTNETKHIQPFLDYCKVKQKNQLLYFDDSVIKPIQKEHPQLSVEQIIHDLNHPGNAIFGCFLACYQNPPFQGTHIPVFCNPEEINQTYTELSSTDFFEWYLNKMTAKQQLSGGHINAWTPEKLLGKLESNGFSAKIRKYKESIFFGRLLSKLMVPDRQHRTFFSLLVSGIKK